MKTKLFTAVLACLSVAMLFSGCKNDKNDDAVHAYVMRAAITEAGDLDALTVTLINSELESMCNQVGTKILTESEAREMFDLMVKQIEKSMESIDFGDITKPVGFTVTLNYQNDGKVAFSKTFTVDPKQRRTKRSVLRRGYGAAFCRCVYRSMRAGGRLSCRIRRWRVCFLFRPDW